MKKYPKGQQPREPFWRRITLRSVGKVASVAIAIEVGLLGAGYVTWKFVLFNL